MKRIFANVLLCRQIFICGSSNPQFCESIALTFFQQESAFRKFMKVVCDISLLSLENAHLRFLFLFTCYFLVFFVSAFIALEFRSDFHRCNCKRFLCELFSRIPDITFSRFVLNKILRYSINHFSIIGINFVCELKPSICGLMCQN